MRRLLSRPRQPRHREAPGNRPTLLRGSAGSPGCTRRGGTEAEASGIRWGQCPPSAHGRAVPGPEGRTPRWSAEKRASSIARGRAVSLARGRGPWCASRRSAPLACLPGEEGTKAYPAPFKQYGRSRMAVWYCCSISDSGPGSRACRRSAGMTPREPHTRQFMARASARREPPSPTRGEGRKRAFYPRRWVLACAGAERSETKRRLTRSPPRRPSCPSRHA